MSRKLLGSITILQHEISGAILASANKNDLPKAVWFNKPHSKPAILR
jgi:hypothetical protein